MTEWGVVVVIIALVGLVGTLLRPVISLNTAITRLTTLLEGLSDDMEQLTKKNSDNHQRLWEHNNKQDIKIQDHESRIVKLEIKKGDK